MALFKVETEVDDPTGKIRASIYYPPEADEPLASTEPIYSSHEEAEEEVIKMMQRAWPAQPVKRA